MLTKGLAHASQMPALSTLHPASSFLCSREGGPVCAVPSSLGALARCGARDVPVCSGVGRAPLPCWDVPGRRAWPHGCVAHHRASPEAHFHGALHELAFAPRVSPARCCPVLRPALLSEPAPWTRAWPDPFFPPRPTSHRFLLRAETCPGAQRWAVCTWSVV